MIARLLSTSLFSACLIGAVLSAGCSDPAPPAGTGGATGSGGASTGSGGASTGSGGAATGSGGAATDPTVPTDLSAAGLEAFLTAGSYKSAPWVFDTATRAAVSHGNVRVYYNPTAVASVEAGNNDIESEAGNSLNSMVVKELFDTTDTQIGTAIMLRTAVTGAQSDWLYYCTSSDQAACEDTAVGPIITGGGQCKFCHAGTFLSEVPAGP